MRKTDCEIVEDLMPLYIDGLTSETSNKLIVEHLQECEECRAKLQRMRDGNITVAKDDVKEIDFLKKTRKHNIKTVIAGILAVLIIVISVIGIRLFVTGQKADKRSFACEVLNDGNHFTFDIMSFNSAESIRNIQFREENGVILVTVKTVLPSFLSSSQCHAEYTAKQPVSMVYVNDRVVWAAGEHIYTLTDDLFFRAHEYMGDMPANQQIANALNLRSRLGSYHNELVTDQQPYRWKIILEEDIGGKELMEYWMERYAYVMIGLIGNLDEVEFICTDAGREYSKLVTKQEADDFFGEDIKTCGKNINALNRLIAKTGLNY